MCTGCFWKRKRKAGEISDDEPNVRPAGVGEKRSPSPGSRVPAQVAMAQAQAMAQAETGATLGTGSAIGGQAAPT
ncbi:hypothetical protein ONS96_002266 [Cadophora gregata f. sp. sojae]|nr:hypothetical protein ONS96_002266 [Cadophora gregata f. sp. sojae]